jgi:hypothetical protein
VETMMDPVAPSLKSLEIKHLIPKIKMVQPLLLDDVSSLKFEMCPGSI